MQTKVNIFPAIAKVGTWATDRLKSAFSYSLRGTGATPSVAATGTITIASNPSANDTVTVGSIVYTFVAADPVGQQVLIGGSTAETATNLAAIISGIATATASSNVVTVTASETGVKGNSIALATSNSSAITVGASLSGGADYIAGNNATIGNAFTVVSKNPDIAIMGGTGKFAGIFVNPDQEVVYNGLTPTLQVPDGVTGELCVSGYIWVALSNESNVGDTIYYTNATGALSAGTAGGSQTQIKGAKVEVGGAAGTPVLISIIPQV